MVLGEVAGTFGDECARLGVACIRWLDALVVVGRRELLRVAAHGQVTIVDVRPR